MVTEFYLSLFGVLWIISANFLVLISSMHWKPQPQRMICLQTKANICKTKLKSGKYVVSLLSHPLAWQLSWQASVDTGCMCDWAASFGRDKTGACWMCLYRLSSLVHGHFPPANYAKREEMFIPENEWHRIRIHNQMFKDKIQLVEKILAGNCRNL